MKKLFFSLFSIIIFSGIVFAQATTTDSCKQFSGIIVAPPENIDKGIFIEETERIQAKGIVINPCQRKPILVERRIFTRPLEFGANPFLLNKSEPKKSAKNRPRVTLQLSESTKDLFKKPFIF
jgi:hypothetical protein